VSYTGNGATGITIQHTIYPITPGKNGTGMIVSTTHNNLATVTSHPRYSANPAQTPATFTSVEDRISRFPIHGAATLAGGGGGADAWRTPQK
jgi:hypothetical protein